MVKQVEPILIYFSMEHQLETTLIIIDEKHFKKNKIDKQHLNLCKKKKKN